MNDLFLLIKNYLFKISEINEYSPNFETILKPQNISFRDNAVEIYNDGNTVVSLGNDKKLQPSEYFRTQLTLPNNVLVWDFYLSFGKENVIDNAEIINRIEIVRTNFHNKAVANYESKNS